jgi:hypothetical protein|tara:strand:- start:3139 stop:3726 length:588 start_codon:yes stop_codon:yes gene_type:complete
MEKKLMYEDKVHKIIQGIAAAMANSYDGATDENGDPIKIGLRREEGNPILDSRVMDGFGCKIQGDLLIVKYNTEENIKGLRGIHHIGLEKYQKEIEQRMADIAKFIKKEAKKATGATVNLKLDGEIDILIQPMNKLRTMVSAVGMYKIAGMKAQKDPKPEGKTRSEANFYKSFISNLKEEKRKKTLGYKPFWRKS